MPVKKGKLTDVESFMLDKFSILPVIGGCYGFYSSVRWSIFSYALYITMYFSVGLVTIDLLYSSCLLIGNISLFSTAFHYFLVGCVVLTASVSLTLHRAGADRVFRESLVTQYLPVYQADSEYKYLQDLSKQTDQRIKKVMIAFVICYGTCGLVAVVAPFADSYMGLDEAVTNVPGIYWKHLPFPMWFPFDAHSSTAAWMMVFFCQGVYALFAPIMVTAAVVLCLWACENILNHIKVLIHALENLDSRGKEIFIKRYHMKPSHRFKHEYDLCYHECIVQNIQHHHAIKKTLEDFLAIANIAIAVPFFGGAMLLGLAGLNLLSQEDPRIGPKLLISCTAMTEAANMLLMCIYGEKFQHESEILFNTIITTNWRKRSMKCRKSLMILQSCSLRPMKITAAKLILLNMETFANSNMCRYFGGFGTSLAGDMLQFLVTTKGSFK